MAVIAIVIDVSFDTAFGVFVNVPVPIPKHPVSGNARALPAFAREIIDHQDPLVQSIVPVEINSLNALLNKQGQLVTVRGKELPGESEVEHLTRRELEGLNHGFSQA